MINEKQKWPTNKREYDRNYLRAFGKVCPECNGEGITTSDLKPCWFCDGIGYVPKEKS